MRYAIFKDIEDVSKRSLLSFPWKWLAILVARNISWHWNEYIIIDTCNYEMVAHWKVIRSVRP